MDPVTRALFTPIALSQLTAERASVVFVAAKPRRIFKGGIVLKDQTVPLPWGIENVVKCGDRRKISEVTHRHTHTKKQQTRKFCQQLYFFVQISGNTVAERQEMCFATSVLHVSA